MTPARALGLLASLALLALGVLIAGAGMGWFGEDTSRSWSVIGALLAGLGVALPISIVQHARQAAQASELDKRRYGGRR